MVFDCLYDLGEVQCHNMSYYVVIFTFSKQAFNESLDFATVHSLMIDINLIDSCQAHLPEQYASNIDSFARSDTGVVTDSSHA